MKRIALICLVIFVLLAGSIAYVTHLRQSGADSTERRAETPESLAQWLSRRIPDSPSLCGYIEAFPTGVTQDDEITIVFLLANLGESPITVDGRMSQYSHLFIKVHDAAGKQLDSGDTHATLIEATKKDFIALRTGQVLATTMTTSPRHWSAHAPGHYTLAVECALYPEPIMPTAWVGGVLSNSLPITVRSR
jgi:hypothetical protein